MKIVIAPDSFKGSLSAERICEQVAKAAYKIIPGAEADCIPVADGGEGTLDSVIHSVNGSYVSVEVKNPLGQTVVAKYGIFDGDKAIIEMAQASGLPLIPGADRNIMKASTYGTGQLIEAAMEKGCRTIYIGLGGSATNDGGMGCAAALGVRFYDEEANLLEPVPENLDKIAEIDLSMRNPNIMNTRFIVMSDVKNPLTGELGATNVFGAQKGANKEELHILEKGMKHYAQMMKKTCSCDVEYAEGAGAAGGLGAGLLAFVNAEIRSGIEQILKIVNFEERIKEADLVITGEGRMDAQSSYGKVVSGIGRICKENHIPCIALVGSMGDGAEIMYEYGIDSIMTTVNGVMSLEEALEQAEALCYQGAERMLRMVYAGRNIGV